MASDAPGRDRRHRLHRCRARPVRPAGRAPASPASRPPRRRAPSAPHALGAERAFASAEELVADPDIDVVHICTPNHLHLPLAEPALAAGKHVVCEKPLALDAAGARRLVEPRRGTGLQAAVPFVYRYYPTVREARERVARRRHRRRCACCTAPTCRTGCCAPTTTTGASTRRWAARSRAFADIGSHWCDLAQFVSGHRITRAVGPDAHRGARAPERRRPPRLRRGRGRHGSGEPQAVTTEDAAVVQFETDGGALGSVVVSQISAGRKNRLWIELDGAAGGARRSTRRTPRSCGAAAARRRRSSAATPSTCRRAAARLASLPPGHPQGYADCFDSFVADVYDAIASGAAPDGLPDFADGLRAAQITDAVLASAASETLGRRRRATESTRRWRDEARLPHRLHARARARGHRRLGRRQRLRGARARRLAAARRPPVHRQPPRGRRLRRGRGRARPTRARRTTGSSSPRSPTTTTTSTPTPPSATPTTRTCARASTRPPRSAASRSARSSAATPAAASPRTCARPSASSRRSSTTRASAA